MMLSVCGVRIAADPLENAAAINWLASGKSARLSHGEDHQADGEEAARPKKSPSGGDE